MERELAIYVSASPEMDPECELLGQLLAEMTRSIRWTIKRTPGRHELANPDLEALRASQFYLILLGTDIVAPIGVEWQAAQEAGLTVFAFRKAGIAASPAAAFFAHHLGISWAYYETAQDFIRRFERDLIETLIRGTPGYHLALADIEALSRRLAALQEGPEGPEAGAEARRGAGRGGVILPTD